MEKRKLLGLLALTLFLPGCAASLHPLATEKEAVFEPSLVGTWVEAEPQKKEEQLICIVVKAGDHSYEVTCTIAGADVSLIYDVQVVKLGKSLFLDGSFKKLPNKVEDVDGLFIGVFPTHSFGPISIEGDFVRVGLLKYDWLQEAINEKKVQIRHEEAKDGILLTAPEDELQQFALKYAGDPDAFAYVKFRRQ